MKPGDLTADYIVIGAGLGGLCAAAYLSRANYRVIVLEKNEEIGGKCGTRMLNGYRYAIGANTFGSRTDVILKDLGIHINWIPAPLRIYGNNTYLSFPLSFSSVKEFKSFGVSLFSLLKVLGKTAFLPFNKMTYKDYVERIVSEQSGRELLFSEAWYIGAHPNWLPASAIKIFLGTYYGYNKPIYPADGAQAIPDAFAEYIKAKGGEVLTGQNVTEIGIEDNAAHGVKAGNWFTAKHGIISNMEINTTYSMLRSDSKKFKKKEIASSYRSAFPIALLLLTLDPLKTPIKIVKPEAKLETNATILIEPICELIDNLINGRVTDSPVCNLIFSDLKAQLLKKDRPSQLPVHVSILWPKSPPKKMNFAELTQSILHEIDKKYPGFAEAVTSSRWLTPPEYEKKFGFSSNPAPVLEKPDYTKPSWRLSVNGLYNVGITVQPSGSHAGCAMESGLRCVKEILNNI